MKKQLEGPRGTITTFGEVFGDGAQINPVRTKQGQLALMLRHGDTEVVARRIEYEGRHYGSPAWKLLKNLTLPSRCRPHGTTSDLLNKSCEFFREYCIVNERDAALLGRVPLATALIDAVPVAPLVMIFGSDRERGAHLIQLLGHLCRHPLLLTGVSASGLRGLPSDARFTYVISQPGLSDKGYDVLQNARNRDLGIPFGGRLLNLFGAQIIHSDDVPDQHRARSALQVRLTPEGARLPPFDLSFEDRIAEFQDMLLDYRHAHLQAACRLQVDTSTISPPLRDLARALCTATPDEQSGAEVFALLNDQDKEIRADQWVSLDTVIVEAILVAGFENPVGAPCVAQLAAFAQEILGRRGCPKTIDDAVVGKHLKKLGFSTQRDSECARLHLTYGVLDRAKALAVQYGVQATNGKSM